VGKRQDHALTTGSHMPFAVSYSSSFPSSPSNRQVLVSVEKCILSSSANAADSVWADEPALACGGSAEDMVAVFMLIKEMTVSSR